MIEPHVSAWGNHRESCAHCLGHPFSPCPAGSRAQDADLATLESHTRDQRQRNAVKWTAETFGPHTLAMDERASRFIEEAIELVQAIGLPIERVIATAQHVYAKPRGEVAQEIGAVGFTLLALAEVAHVSADNAETTEMRRVFAIDPEHFRRRHNAKADAGIAVRVEEKKS